MTNSYRRGFLRRGARVAASAALLPGLSAYVLQSAAATTMQASGMAAGAEQSSKQRIGIIGAGHVGGTLGKLWTQAGHEVLFATRHPDELKGLVQEAGPKAQAGTPHDAALFGAVVFFAVPYRALPELAQTVDSVLAGKVLLDACNPFADRDGDLGAQALRDGAGVTTARLFPGTRVVRGFSSVSARTVAAEAHKSPPLGVPIAGDDRAAVDTVASLVRDAGCEPVVVGGLAAAARFQPGGPLWLQSMSAEELRQRVAAF